MKIVEEKDRILFVFEVINSTDLSGVAVWNDRIGWFSDKDNLARGDREANICFIWRRWTLEVVSANTTYYFGRRATINGTYYKIGELDEQEQTKALSAAQGFDDTDD